MKPKKIKIFGSLFLVGITMLNSQSHGTTKLGKFGL